MKKLLLTVVVAIGCYTANAQSCVPTWTGSGSGIQPDTTTNLPHATEGLPYSSVIHFKVPHDTTFSGFPATVDTIIIGSVSGLNSIPASIPFAYDPTPSSGKFLGDSLGCVLITGTPSVGSAGNYPIVVSVTIKATTSFGPLSIPQTVNGYRIVVDPVNAIATTDLRRNGLVAYPSVTTASTTLSYFTPSAAVVSFALVNTLGQKVMERRQTSDAGTNELSLDLGALPEGQYIVTMQTDAKFFSTRVTLNR